MQENPEIEISVASPEYAEQIQNAVKIFQQMDQAESNFGELLNECEDKNLLLLEAVVPQEYGDRVIEINEDIAKSIEDILILKNYIRVLLKVCFGDISNHLAVECVGYRKEIRYENSCYTWSKP